jgi:streptogramin lyase
MRRRHPIVWRDDGVRGKALALRVEPGNWRDRTEVLVRRTIGTTIVSAAAAMLLIACAAGGQTAQVTVWKLPLSNTNLFDLCSDGEGQILVALPGSRAVALLDPESDAARLLPVRESPVSLAWTGEGLFFTFYGGIGFLDPKTGETASWRVPSPVGKVRSLVEAEFTTESVSLWFVQESPDKVGVFEPSTIPRTPPDEDEPELLELAPVRTEVDASVYAVEPTSYALETPLLFRTIASYQGDFARWTPFVRTRGVDRIAVGALARMWFSQGGDTIFLFESFSDSIYRHSLADGTVAGSVTASPSGAIWFIDAATRAVCRLDPKANDVTSWPLPEGGTPYDIAAGESGVWISDRTGGAVYHLDPATGEFRRWEVGPKAKPSVLRIDASGSVWFIEEADKAIGRLTVDES